MTIHADMIIFHEPDVLEFSGKGKSLGRARLSGAETLFCSVRRAPESQRMQLIQNTYYQFFGGHNA